MPNNIPCFKFCPFYFFKKVGEIRSYNCLKYRAQTRFKLYLAYAYNTLNIYLK